MNSLFSTFRRAHSGWNLVLIAVVLTACEEGPPPPASDAPEPLAAPPTLTIGKPQCDPTKFEPAGVMPRRLTNLEYRNTLRDVFEIELPDNLRLPKEEETLGFDNNAKALQITPLHAERLMLSAEASAQLVLRGLDRIMPCTDDDEPSVCIEGFIAAFAPRIWRRPLTDDEHSRLVSLFEIGREAGDGRFEEGASLLLEGLLQSPHFLYRFETGKPVPDKPGFYELTSYEMASKLSYFLWRTLPDDALFEAAAQDALRTPAQIDEQVERMLNDERSRDAFWTFFAQWLHLDEIDELVRDQFLHPDFDESSREALLAQVRMFIDETVWSPGGSIRALFGKPYRLETDPPQAKRVGILGQPAFLAVTSKPNMTSPIHRGVFVREQLLCSPLPPPPPDAMVVAPDPDPTLTTREIFEIHTADAACAGCHNLIDPIGLGFENFDELGRWRDEENGLPVDASGLVTRTIDMDGPFDGAAELGARMATSEHVHRCVVSQVLRYGLGRGETETDGCMQNTLYDDYVESGYDFRALVRSLATHPAFRYRSVGDSP